MIKKHAYLLQMNSELNDEEKSVAKRALIRSKKAEKDLRICIDFINLFYTPFKDNEGATPEDIFKIRASLRTFRDKNIENFNNFKMSAFYLLECLEYFSTDVQTIKIVNSFNSYIDELESLINKLSQLFKNLESKDFAKEAIDLLDMIKNKIEDVIDMLDNRINKHIKENMLSINWRDELAVQLDKTIKEHVPILLELGKKKSLND